MTNNYFTDKKIWITGASSGIGKALAIHLDKLGATLALSGRNETALASLKQSLKSTKHIVVTFDVTNKEANIDAANTINQQLGGIDIVILNAGISEYSDIENFNSDVYEKLIKTNYLSVIYGIEGALPHLKQSSHPHIAGMCSIASYAGLPQSSPYTASKAAVRNVLQGLRFDLERYNTPVSTVCPGFIKTPLTDKHNFKMPFIMPPEKAAKLICKGIAKQKHEIHFPKIMSFGQKLLASLPSKLYHKLVLRACKKVNFNSH